MHYDKVKKRFSGIPKEALNIMYNDFPDKESALIQISLADIPGYGMYEAKEVIDDIYNYMNGIEESNSLSEPIKVISTIVSNMYDEIYEDEDSSDKDLPKLLDKAIKDISEYIVSYDDEVGTYDNIEQMVRSILLDGDIYGDLNVYINEYGEDTFDNLIDNLKDSPYYKLTEEVISSTTMGDYIHNGGGKAGNAFYDPDLNEATRPKNPVANITYESKEYLKSIIKDLLKM